MEVTPMQGGKIGDYKAEILRVLAENLMGETVTGISKTLGISRNTVSKYLGILEAQQLISKQDVGAYSLYFTKERSSLSQNLVITFFRGFLAGLKKVFPQNPNIFKGIGSQVEQFISFPLIGGEIDQIKTWLHNLSHKEFFEAFAFLLPRLFIIAENVRVKSVVIDPKFENALYVLTDTPLLEDEIYSYGFYVLTGFIETYFRVKYNVKLTCDVVECKFSRKADENFAKISLKIS